MILQIDFPSGQPAPLQSVEQARRGVQHGPMEMRLSMERQLIIKDSHDFTH